EPDSGVYGLNKQWKAGRMAMGKSSQTSFALGEAFDAVVIDGTQPLIATSSSENRISTFIYAGDPSFIKGTIVGGQWQVKEGIHPEGGKITADFIRVLRELKVR
ncbi:MAG: formimidoylglutamate deiminase, partial [Bacteroidetes bacterium]|nr:formimidoylglutamate deiminase [Bacteroidota bacterium]